MDRRGKGKGKASSSSSSSRVDRKTAEKNRRVLMKGLCSALTSLIPSQQFDPPKEMLSQAEQLEQATTYIMQLRERVEQLKGRKEQASQIRAHENVEDTDDDEEDVDAAAMNIQLPLIEVKDLCTSIEVLLIAASGNNFIMHQVIRVLEEEGTEVGNASFSTLGNKSIYNIQAKVKNPRVGVDSSTISERLQQLLDLY